MTLFHDFEMEDFKTLTPAQVKTAGQSYRAFLLYEAGKLSQDFYFKEILKSDTDWDMLPAEMLQHIKQDMIDRGQITEADIANA